MKSLYIIRPREISKTLEKMIKYSIGEYSINEICDIVDIPVLLNCNILVALELDELGFCMDVLGIIGHIKRMQKEALLNSKGIVFVHGSSELYTKSAARDIIFILNSMGCSFIGHPVVEATASLKNFLTWQKTMKMPLLDICIEMAKICVKRLMEDETEPINNPNILALHASSSSTSNTLMLFNMIEKYLKTDNISVLHVENGEVLDCIGCSFRTCIHYSKQKSCFYGGIMVEEIYPAIEKADAIVWIAPNYNDTLSANLSAVINRITALYRQISFQNKSIFGVIVSGNSGSDLIAKQLIGALNINKGFRLPPRFCIMETTNDPGSIKSIEDIEQKSKDFAVHMIENVKRLRE